MSSSQSFKESSTGRRYTHRQDEYGKTVRRYAEDSGESHPSSSRREPSRIDPYETPRSESTSRPDRRASTYVPSSSSSARRGSTSSHKQDPYDGPGGGHGSSQPITIYKDSSRYHGAGGFDQRRDGREPLDSEDLRSPSRPRGNRDHEYHASDSYTGSRTIRDLPPSSDADILSNDFGALTMNAINDRSDYIVSASAPAPSGHWPPSSRGTRPGPIIHEPEHGRGSRDVSSNVPEGPSISYQDKGKNVVHEMPDTHSSQQGSRHIVGTPGEVEKLDSSYKVRNQDYKKFFKPGRIFSTLWTDSFAEPTNASENDQFLTRVTYVAYGERVHSKIRRFVVVHQKNRCCVCLPVTTYSGKGSRKSGLNLNEHGLIYSGARPPHVDGINKEPLKALLNDRSELVNSYINYGRPYTVETNVKVKDVGELDSTSKRLLVQYYNEQNIAVVEENIGNVPRQIRQGREVEFTGMSGGSQGFGGNYNPNIVPIGAPFNYNPPPGNYPPPHLSSRANYSSQAGNDSSAYRSGNRPPDTGYGGQFNPTDDNRGGYYVPNQYNPYPSASAGAPLPYHSGAPGPAYSMDRPLQPHDQSHIPPHHQRYDSFPPSHYSNQGYTSNPSAVSGPPIYTSSGHRPEDSQYISRSTAPPIARTPQYETFGGGHQYASDRPLDARSSRVEPYPDSAIEDGEYIQLPSLEEAERARRASASSGRSHGSRRDRDRGYDRRR